MSADLFRAVVIDRLSYWLVTPPILAAYGLLCLVRRHHERAA